MKSQKTLNTSLGIISGGQLGKMLSIAAQNWNVNTAILDPEESCPAAQSCDELYIGDYKDYDNVFAFGKSIEIIILEIEHVNVDALYALQAAGKRIYPSPQILQMVQDKGLQKQFLTKHDFKTSDFHLYETSEEIKEACSNGTINIPFVQKTRTMGYDGMGVKIVRSESDLESLLAAPSVVEDLVDIDKELAVIVARNASGHLKCFPVVEMTFIEGANLVDQLICPADISSDIAKHAETLASNIANTSNLEGILAVEMFLTKSGEILVNEIAPRPHNSGHHTIEACITSQYEQLLRAAFNLPLGSTDVKIPAVMINILGEDGYVGQPNYEGLEESMTLEGVSFHIYGKQETRPKRKMGHATIVNKDKSKAIEIANTLKSTLKVTA